MANTITGDSSGGYDNSIDAPADGEDIDATPIEDAAQTLLDNLKYAWDLVVGGVLAIRSVANDAALKAILAKAEGQVAWVKKRGLYIYIDPLLHSDLEDVAEPWAVLPTAGTGVWAYVGALL